MEVVMVENEERGDDGERMCDSNKNIELLIFFKKNVKIFQIQRPVYYYMSF